MNKLLINHSARNHIKIFPMQDAAQFLNMPATEAESIAWCNNIFENLRTSKDAKELSVYGNRKSGYRISVWELGGLYYLVQCLKNEFNTFNTTIYISKEQNDMLAISKFLKENIETIMSDYKDQILDARDALLKERIHNEA